MEEPWKVCITPCFLVESSSDLCGYFEGGKEVKETPTLVVTSTTRTYACLSGEPNLGINLCVPCAYCCCDYCSDHVGIATDDTSGYNRCQKVMQGRSVKEANVGRTNNKGQQCHEICINPE